MSCTEHMTPESVDDREHADRGIMADDLPVHKHEIVGIEKLQSRLEINVQNHHSDSEAQSRPS